MSTPPRAPTRAEIEAQLDELLGQELAAKVRLRATRVTVADGRTHTEIELGIPSPEINDAVKERLSLVRIARAVIEPDVM